MTKFLVKLYHKLYFKHDYMILLLLLFIIDLVFRNLMQLNLNKIIFFIVLLF